MIYFLLFCTTCFDHQALVTCVFQLVMIIMIKMIMMINMNADVDKINTVEQFGWM